MIKNLGKVNTDNILNEYYKLEHEIVWKNYISKGKQCGLQYKENEDPWTSAVGKSKGQEFTYELLNNFFKDSIFEKIIIEYNLKRTRLMWLEPYSCYSMHKDDSCRIHIPLITNTECYFIFKIGLIKHLELGNAYLVDTKKMHTFINTSNQARLHLVGVVDY
jgi:hypothetical protein